MTEVSRDFVQLLQAFHRLDLYIIFIAVSLNATWTVFAPATLLPGTALSLLYPCTKLVCPVADITKVVAEGEFRLLLEIENGRSACSSSD